MSLFAALVFNCPSAYASDKDKASTVKSDESIILFPTVARLPKGGDAWEISLHGWIFEKHHFSTLRDWWARLRADDDDLSKEVDLEGEDVAGRTPTSMSSTAPAAPHVMRSREILKQRSHYFLVDNERGKRIALKIAGSRFVSDRSAPNGHFHGTARLDRRTLNDHLPVPTPTRTDRDLIVPVSVDLAADDNRRFSTEVFFLGEQGISVVSDIDDTIKITECLSKRACTRNTFLRPFREVPGMSELYQDWARQGATIHYVSACPWQLYEPVTTFLREAGFPVGPTVMKEFRWKDRSVFDMFDSPEEYKISRVGALLEQFPNRRFILVGDSGQSDPEAYGALARRFPNSIKRIYIRDVGGGHERYRGAFRDVPADRWSVFKEAGEIEKNLERVLSPPKAQGG